MPCRSKYGQVVLYSSTDTFCIAPFPTKPRVGYRQVLVNQYMSAESLLPWFLPRERDYQGINDCWDIVMISGQDPYAWKGLEVCTVSRVRPNGEGGCVKKSARKRS